MKKYEKKISFCLALMIVLFSVLVDYPVKKAYATQSRTDNFYKTYTLTGNAADDIVSVALAQAGRTTASLGYTEDWCADFVSDCAALAGASAAIPLYGECTGLRQRILAAGGKVVNTPQKGDLVFYYCAKKRNYAHVGIMKSQTHSIQGNVNGIVYDNITMTGDYTYRDAHNDASPTYVRPNYGTGIKPIGGMSVTPLKGCFATGESIIITWTTAENAEKYGLTVRNTLGVDVFDQYVTGNSKNIGELAEGDYTVMMTPYGGSGRGAMVTSSFSVKKSSSPVIKDVQFKLIDKKDGFVIYIYATDDIRVNHISLDIWTEKNGKDDMETRSAVMSYLNGEKIWVYEVYSMYHNNEYGVYMVHLRVSDDDGNVTEWEGKTELPQVEQEIPNVQPTVTPMVSPSAVPTLQPTVSPSIAPTLQPTVTPSNVPALLPTVLPSVQPTITPNVSPEATLAPQPTVTPSVAPTIQPTVSPSAVPTLQPTSFPTVTPTEPPIKIDESMPMVVITSIVSDVEYIQFYWNMVTGITGFEIQYCTKPDKSDAVSGYWENGSALGGRLVGTGALLANTTYYYRLRTYKIESGMVTYSKWTEWGSATTKSKTVNITPTVAPTTTPRPVATARPTATPTPSSSNRSTWSDSSSSTVKKPGKITGVTVSNKKGYKLAVHWKWSVDASGFQVQYALNKKFTKGKRTVKAGEYASSKTVKVQKKKTYYVRVRAYKEKSGQVKYGAWSAVKHVKIKK